MRLLIPQCMHNVWIHGSMDSVFSRQVMNSSSTALANVWQGPHEKGFSSVCIRVWCMSKNYLHQKIFGHYLHTRTGSHQNVYYVYMKYHSMKMGLYISHLKVSLSAYRHILQGRISHHKYHTYIICPLHVHDEAGGHAPNVQRLCYK